MGSRMFKAVLLNLVMIIIVTVFIFNNVFTKNEPNVKTVDVNIAEQIEVIKGVK